MATEQSFTYIAIDLKSFYASVECVERNLDPLNTNLIVADASRTDKTITLAATPAIKSFGISSRGRLFEVKSRMREVNTNRQLALPDLRFRGSSVFLDELEAHPEFSVDYLVAPPRMALYIQYSVRIYEIYLHYIAPEDMHVYSIDEVFIDITHYLSYYNMDAWEFSRMLLKAVLDQTGITATVGIGPNLYLAKVAMDIEAKHQKADQCGARIAALNEESYRKKLWDHRPLTDFWRIGKGYAGKLASVNLFTMKDVALCSIGKASSFYNEDLLYRLFGINAELLIDHAWGWEPCTIKDIKSYKPKANSLSSGQVLTEPYDTGKAAIVLLEMAEGLILDLHRKKLKTNQIVLSIGYDRESLNPARTGAVYRGPVVYDHYGRLVPKHAHGSVNLLPGTDSPSKIRRAAESLFRRIINPNLLVRRITLTAADVFSARSEKTTYEQLSLFDDAGQIPKQNAPDSDFETEKRLEEAILAIQDRFGKNAMLKGMNLKEGATAMERNRQIGGHRA